jgi:hypothetical protein
MKKLLLSAGLLLAISASFMACNKGDDNPFADRKCVCDIKQWNRTSDTTGFFVSDTVFLFLEDMDLETATNFCNKKRDSYTDTLGSKATCVLK